MELNLKLIDTTTDPEARKAMIEYFCQKIHKVVNKAEFYKLRLDTASQIFSKISNISVNLVIKILKGFVNTYGKTAVSLLAYLNCENLDGKEREIFEILDCIPIINCLSKYNPMASCIVKKDSEDEGIEDGTLMVDYQWCYEREKEKTQQLHEEIKILRTSSSDIQPKIKVIETLIKNTKQIKVTSSCTEFSSNVESLLDLSHKLRFSSNNVKNTWVEYSFEEPVKAVGYEIMTNGDYRTPRSWKVEIISYSNDDSDMKSGSWEVVDQLSNCKKLPNRSVTTVPFPIPTTKPFRRLRFTQTDKNAAGTHCFIFKYFEIIGYFVHEQF